MLPGARQLEKYARRLSFRGSEAATKIIVTLSECTQEYAKAHSVQSRIAEIPVRHISWRDLVADCRDAKKAARSAERRVLGELEEYLETVMTSQQKDSNLAYVLTLNAGTRKGWKTSWVEIVSKYRRYFHPLGGSGWLKEPPNYLAFRYGGRLRSIHHVESYSVMENYKQACPGIPTDPCEPHFLYELGEPIAPTHEVKNGKIWPNGRYWCAIDTLLTSRTISEARDETKRRIQSARVDR